MVVSNQTIADRASFVALMRHGKYDIVHVNNTFTYQVPTLLAAGFAGIPVIAHVRNPVADEQFTRFLARHVNCWFRSRISIPPTSKIWTHRYGLSLAETRWGGFPSIRRHLSCCAVRW
jgi:hypothetical protein